MFLLLIEYHERRKLIKLSKTIVIRFFLFFALLGKVSSIGLNRVQNAELKHVVPRQLSRANLHVLQVSVQNISDFLSSLNRGDSSEQNGLMATETEKISSKTSSISKEVNSLRKVAPIKVSNRIFERPLSTVIKEEKLRFVVVPELQQDLTIYQHFSLTGARALLKSQMKPIVIIPKHSKTQPGMVIGTVKLPVMPSISVIDDELPFGTEIFMNRLKHRRKKFILSEIRK
ncbi:unnamed protein product, partial [Mesorhabditis belari]|uniref:Uncharacterized protein n=1 Tax=Mesorhabditis belari TaxID=2138241 RepID=A0AAF3ESR6_9BILA